MARKAQTAPARRNAKTAPNRAKIAPKPANRRQTSAKRGNAPKNAPKKPPAKRLPAFVSHNVGSSPIYLHERPIKNETHIVCHRADMKELTTGQFIALLEIFAPYHERIYKGRKARFAKPGVIGRYADWYGVGCVFDKAVSTNRIALRLSKEIEERFGFDD